MLQNRRIAVRVKQRAMFKFLRVSALLLVALTISHGARAAPYSGAGVDEFFEIVEISRLPPDQQTPKIAQIYEWYPELIRGNQMHFTRMQSAKYPELTTEEKRLSGKEQLILAFPRGSWQRYVSTDSYEIARRILDEHPDEFASLIHDDLRGDDAARQARGLTNLLNLPSVFWAGSRENTADSLKARWFGTFYADVARVFQNAPPYKADDSIFAAYYRSSWGPLKAQAGRALVQLGDTRAIALLVNDDTAQPTLHYWAISHLAVRAPDDTALQRLVPLLHSDEAVLRYRALFALPTGIESVRVALPALLEDADAKTRALATEKTFKLGKSEFEPLKAQLKKRLADADSNVRLNAATGFAYRGDAIAAPVLLKLWTEKTGGNTPLIARVVLERLMDENRGGLLRENPDDRWRFDAKDERAVALVEAWIVQHPAN